MDPPEMKLDTPPENDNGKSKDKNKYSHGPSGGGGGGIFRLTSRRGSTGYHVGHRHGAGSGHAQPVVAAVAAPAEGSETRVAAARARSRGRRRATVMPDAPIGLASKNDGGHGNFSENIAAAATKGAVENKHAKSRRHSVCHGNGGVVDVSKTNNHGNHSSHNHNHSSSGSSNMNHIATSFSKSRRHSVVHGNVANQIAVNTHHPNKSGGGGIHKNAGNGNGDNINDAKDNYHSSRRASVANVNDLQGLRFRRRRASSHKPPSNGGTLLSREEMKLLQLQASFRSSARGNLAGNHNESELYDMSFVTRYSDEVGVGIEMGMGAKSQENDLVEGGDGKKERQEEMGKEPKKGDGGNHRKAETKGGAKNAAEYPSRSRSRKTRSRSRLKETAEHNERSPSPSAYNRRLYTVSKHYELGDDWDDAFPYDVILPPPKKYESKDEERKQRQKVLECVKTLQLHDFVFVRRSNGKWSYGIVAGKSLESEMMKNRKKGKDKTDIKDGNNHNGNEEGNNSSGNDHNRLDGTKHNHDKSPNPIGHDPTSFHSALNGSNKHHDQEAILVVVSTTGATKTIPKSHWGVLLRKARVYYDDAADYLTAEDQEADETERGISVAARISSSSRSSISGVSKKNSDDGSASSDVNGIGRGSGIDKSDLVEYSGKIIDDNNVDIPKCIQIGQSNHDNARLMQKQSAMQEEKRAVSRDQPDDDKNHHQDQDDEVYDSKSHGDGDGDGRNQDSQSNLKQERHHHRDRHSTDESQEQKSEKLREINHRPVDPPECNGDDDEQQEAGEEKAEKYQEKELEQTVLEQTEPGLSKERSRHSREDHPRRHRHYQQEHNDHHHHYYAEMSHERHHHQGEGQEDEEGCIIDPYTLTDTHNLEGRTITLQEKDFDDDVSELYGDHWHSAWGEERKRRLKQRAKQNKSDDCYHDHEIVNMEEVDEENDDDDGETEAQEDFNKMQLLHRPSNRNLKQDRSLRTHILKEHRSSLRLVEKQQTKYGGYDNEDNGGDGTMGKNVNNDHVNKRRGSGSGNLQGSKIFPVMPCEVEAHNFADELRRSQESTPTTHTDVSDSSSYSSC
ncbi:hypothetical protein ACHAXS_006713 [Conticribra weissflogii]